MNLNSLQFISHRDSIASNFAEESEKSSSMVSSRKKFQQQETQNDLQDFKQEIRFKFLRSVANKTFVFPLTQQGFDCFDDQQEYSDLVGVSEYSLFDQGYSHNADRFKKQQFKIKNPKLTSKTANLLIETLKTERQRIANLRSHINQSLISRKQKSAAVFYTDIPENSNRQFGRQEASSGHNYRKKRLNTQPYEKPVGFVIKKGDKLK